MQCIQRGKKREKLATAIHYNVRPLDVMPVLLRVNNEAHTKFKVGQPVCSWLI